VPKLYSSSHIIKVLQSKGFLYISQKGSHVKFRKIGKPTLTVIIPAGRKEIPLGTFKSILRQANLTIKDFNKKI
jgi:predicted RNA binding protein YcfA (HicA-like mRNA interferase family)